MSIQLGVLQDRAAQSLLLAAQLPKDREYIAEVAARASFAATHALSALPAKAPHHIGPGKRTLKLRIGRAYAPNGKRETTRRRRQIALGSLNAANGLAAS